MYCFAFVVPPHHYSSSMLGGALPSGKRSDGTRLWKLEVFQNSSLHPPHLLPFLFNLSFTLSLCPCDSPSLLPPSHLGLILGEHLTDVLLKDEKRSGGESKSKQRSTERKKKHGRMGKTLLNTHTRIPIKTYKHTCRSPEDYCQCDTGHFREKNICSFHIW